MSDIQPNTAAFDALRSQIAGLGAEYGTAAAVIDGVNSNKVRAFKAIMAASMAGFVFEGQALTLASEWASATGSVLSTASQASAASKAKVWIMAGKSNHAPDTVALMDQLASADRDKATRYFEKMTTALRRSKKEGRPLTEAECNLILTGGSEEESDALKEFVGALKRVCTGWKAACDAMPDDLLAKQRLEQAEADYAVADAKLKARDAADKVAGIVSARNDKQPTKQPEAQITDKPTELISALAAPVSALAEAPVAPPVTIDTAIHSGLFLVA